MRGPFGSPRRVTRWQRLRSSSESEVVLDAAQFVFQDHQLLIEGEDGFFFRLGAGAVQVADRAHELRVAVNPLTPSPRCFASAPLWSGGAFARVLVAAPPRGLKRRRFSFS